MKTYLVTGGAGFIGSNYIHYMFKKYGDDIRIINVDALTYAGNLENLKDIESRRNYTFIKADITDKEAVAKAIREVNPDAVVHCAAWTAVDAAEDEENQPKVRLVNVTGTQNIAGVIGMGKAISYLENIGMNKIMKHEHELKNYLVSKLKELDNIIIYNEDTVGSIVTFNVKDIFSQDTAIYLDKHHICIRSGNHCSKILNQVFDISNTCRVSLGIYNTDEEIDALVDALKNIGNIWMEIS